MSIARLTHDSDVYVYQDADGGYSCCFCKLNPDIEIFNVATANEMISHLEEHQSAGNKVTVYAFDKLREEIELGR